MPAFRYLPRMLERSERDITPMARENGMALAPWNVGRDRKLNNHGWKCTEEEKKMSKALESVAKEVRVESITTGNYTEVTHSTAPLTHSLNLSVAIAYLMHKAPYMFPTVGGCKAE